MKYFKIKDKKFLGDKLQKMKGKVNGKRAKCAFHCLDLKRFLCVNLRANNRDIHMGSNNKKMNCVFRILKQISSYAILRMKILVQYNYTNSKCIISCLNIYNYSKAQQNVKFNIMIL